MMKDVPMNETETKPAEKPAVKEKENEARAERRYKTAFFIMTGISCLLLATLVGTLFIQNAGKKKTAFYRDLIETTEDAVDVRTAVDDGLVNVNTADKEELQQLPGIGEARAEQIIAYREEYGRFTKAEDLLNIPGIGSTVLERMKPYLVFEEETAAQNAPESETGTTD